ncbi:Aspartyl protease [Popillia japonica]|uniref:Aspartyl protease n=1 Tax=Popillia japonica TaxID=7064 RepID=A0AAW1IEL0_POPJA
MSQELARIKSMGVRTIYAEGHGNVKPYLKPETGPKFSGHLDKLHPMTYLRNIKRLTEDITDARLAINLIRLTLIEKALEWFDMRLTEDITDARLAINLIRLTLIEKALEWFDMVSERCNTTVQFEQEFRKQYWNETQQDRQRIQLLTGRYREGPTTRENYATDMFNRCKNIPALSEQDIAKYLLNHFILSDNQAIICQDVEDMEQLMKILRRLDDLSEVQRAARMNQHNRLTYPPNAENNRPYNGNARYQDYRPTYPPNNYSRPDHHNGRNRNYREVNHIGYRRSPTRDERRRNSPEGNHRDQAEQREYPRENRPDSGEKKTPIIQSPVENRPDSGEKKTPIIQSPVELMSLPGTSRIRSRRNIYRLDAPRFYDNPHKFLSEDPEEILEESNHALPYINVRIQNLQISAIIDTAAEVSLIRKEVVDKLEDIEKNIVNIKKIQIISTKQKKLGTLSKKLNIEVKVNNQPYIMEFYVFEEMKVERIIGIDSIRNMEMVLNLLNFEENILKIGKNELELQRYEEGKCICNSWNEKVNEEGNRMVSEEKDYAVYYEEVDEEQEACDAPDGEFIRNSIYYSVDVDERYLNELLNGISPHHYKDQVEKEIIQLQKQGIIERSNSYFINRVVLVKKADGSIRICLDAREVNKRIKPGYENPQNITRHPQTNLSERIIKEIIKYMRILLQDNHQLWARNLPKVEYILNNTPSTIHERSPIEIMCLENPHRPWNAAELSNYQEIYLEAKEKLLKKKRKWEAKTNEQRRKLNLYKINDLVLLKNHRVIDKKNKQVAKFMKPYVGPFRITNTFGNATYELSYTDQDKVKGRYHINLLNDYIISKPIYVMN